MDFPDVSEALGQPNGLLCAGGELSVECLTVAYSLGIFPWFSEGDPILWWSPDPRLVLQPNEFKLRKSLVKAIRKQHFEIQMNTAFDDLVGLCAQQRKHTGTWITKDMQRVYSELHYVGRAISIETYQNQQLVGGLYGIKLGSIFFGESMVSLVSDASKAALAYLCAPNNPCQIILIDCQVPTSHLKSLGARLIPRQRFIEILNRHCHE